uniref:Uncharacterized protein n=1 Tax=Caulobacter phage BL57 TaxID=3348355 RepID=A0AB74UG92_9VIRU
METGDGGSLTAPATSPIMQPYPRRSTASGYSGIVTWVLGYEA